MYSDEQTVICPICNEHFQNLEYLNYHLDEYHDEDELDLSSSLFTWFKKTKDKVLVPIKKATSVTLLGGYELNDNSVILSEIYGFENGSEPVDPETLIAKDHWEDNSDSYCPVATCGRTLGIMNGKYNCRRFDNMTFVNFSCGKQFCDFHTSFEMRLTPDASHNPEVGLWYRVCQSCYVGRDGYNDFNGPTRSKFSKFKKSRAVNIESILLEANKLEKRLSKLIDHYSQNQVSEDKTFDQTVVEWQADSTTNSCFSCNATLYFFTRRHHCRLCGNIVCSSCLRFLNVSPTGSLKRDSDGDLLTQIKVCQECEMKIKRNIQHDDDEITKILKKIEETIKKEQRIIEEMLPTFNNTLSQLRLRKIDIHDPLYQKGLKQRKILLDSFARLETLAKDIKRLSGENSVARLYDGINRYLISYLQTHMFTLQLMPRPKGISKQKNLLIEQRNIVKSYLENAINKRRIEDIEALKINLEEIEREIEELADE